LPPSPIVSMILFWLNNHHNQNLNRVGYGEQIRIKVKDQLRNNYIVTKNNCQVNYNI
jgi:hypothetical protein